MLAVRVTDRSKDVCLMCGAQLKPVMITGGTTFVRDTSY